MTAHRAGRGRRAGQIGLRALAVAVVHLVVDAAFAVGSGHRRSLAAIAKGTPEEEVTRLEAACLAAASQLERLIGLAEEEAAAILEFQSALLADSVAGVTRTTLCFFADCHLIQGALP